MDYRERFLYVLRLVEDYLKRHITIGQLRQEAKRLRAEEAATSNPQEHKHEDQ